MVKDTKAALGDFEFKVPTEGYYRIEARVCLDKGDGKMEVKTGEKTVLVSGRPEFQWDEYCLEGDTITVTNGTDVHVIRIK